jgi:hypothetical protein
MRPNVSSSQRRRRLRDHEEALEEKIIKPFLVGAENEQNLKESNRLRASAELLRMLYSATAVQRAKLAKQVIEHGLSGEGGSLDLSNLVRGFEAAFKALKEDD